MSEEEREEAEKRAHHNALERKRRDHIKDSFLSLREAVPSLKGEKASRAQILKKTAEYIQFMNKKNEDHRSAIENLTRLNNILEKQISILEKTQGAGNFAVESGENSNAGNAYNSDNSDYEQTTTPTMKSKRKKKFDSIL